MPFAEINGIPQHYALRGSGNRCVVLVHGYGGAAEDWLGLANCLADSARVVVPDNRGNGVVEIDASRHDFSVATIAADLTALLETLEIETFHLLGHSMGGAVAQELALVAPERVKSLLLCDTTDFFGDHDQPGGTPPWIPEAGQQQARRRYRAMGAAVAALWAGLIGWPGVRDRLADINCPALVLHGSRDASRILEGSARLVGELPNAELCIIDEAGHSPHLEAPGVFNARVRDFVDRVDPTA